MLAAILTKIKTPPGGGVFERVKLSYSKMALTRPKLVGDTLVK